MKELLKKFNMDNAKEMKTPMHLTTYLTLNEELKKMRGLPGTGGISTRGFMRHCLILLNAS